jgi:serine phosphatase RsbU (regulator of sigma subunit)
LFSHKAAAGGPEPWSIGPFSGEVIRMPAIDDVAAESAAKKLYRLVEPCYADLRASTDRNLLLLALERTRDRLGEHCGISAALLAGREGSRWEIVAGIEEDLAARLRGAISVEDEEFLRQRMRILPGPPPVVCWILGSRGEWTILLELREEPGEETVTLLQMARMVVHQRMVENSWTDTVDRVRAIQRSLLPDPLPRLAGFDLAALSEPAEEVGGDAYDAVRLSDDALGIMIADASGHGLPAALEARDVVIGLRMGAERHLKIDAMMERLNRVLCGATLSSRFVSLVYGEIYADGFFHYVNAGHPSPILLTDHDVRFLTGSGRLLGITADSRYQVRHTLIPPGGTLILYTDGIVECPSPAGQEFGAERLARLASGLREAPAAGVARSIVSALREHSRRESFPDDATLLVVKRPAGLQPASDLFQAF